MTSDFLYAYFVNYDSILQFGVVVYNLSFLIPIYAAPNTLTFGIERLYFGIGWAVVLEVEHVIIVFVESCSNDI